jgi:hypothetical protein
LRARACVIEEKFSENEKTENISYYSKRKKKYEEQDILFFFILWVDVRSSIQVSSFPSTDQRATTTAAASPPLQRAKPNPQQEHMHAVATQEVGLRPLGEGQVTSHRR